MRKWQVYSNVVTQYFSRFDSGFALHDKSQHLFGLVLGGKIQEHIFSLVLRNILKQYFSTKYIFLFVDKISAGFIVHKAVIFFMFFFAWGALMMLRYIFLKIF